MANEKRLIDANSFIQHFEDAKIKAVILPTELRDILFMLYSDIKKEIEKQPIVDAVEVVHGKWENSDIPHEKFCCSVCGGACWYYDYEGDVARSRYCPNCGAKMDLKGGE